MDENYLDNLLNEISLDKEIDHKIEDELDQQLQEEKRKKQAEDEVSKEESFDLKLDEEVSEIADPIDLQFSEEQMEELDALDNLADLDIGDLDFADIDFDDVDVTKLDDLKDADFDDLLKDFEGDLEIDEFFHQGEQEKEFPQEEDISQSEDTNESMNELESLFDAVAAKTLENPEVQENEKEDLNEDSFDANAFLDSLLDETEESERNSQTFENLEENDPTQMELSESQEEGMVNADSLDDIQMPEQNEGIQQTEDNSSEGSDASEEIPDLDDLLSMLDLEDGDANSGTVIPDKTEDTNVSEQNEAVISDELDDTAEQTGKADKQKKSFMQILFGDPDDDEDELSPEELEAIEAKKALKKAEKKAKKEAAKKEKEDSDKAKKDLKNDQKKKAADEKAKLRAEKKAKKMAAAAEDMEESQKKLNKPMVIFVFTFFLGAVFLFYAGTNNFNYTQAIEKASNFFAKQKYRRAYDEIAGVEVKEKDQDLKDRIYTVMYVERLYESYNNNIKLENEEKALDSLLRGVVKYYEYYDEAQELGITEDLDYSFNQIVSALQMRYGIGLEQAMAINELENLEYVHTIEMYAENADTSAGVETPPEENIPVSENVADEAQEEVSAAQENEE